MTKIAIIEQLPNFAGWAITDSFWGIIKEQFSSYDEALDTYEDENGYQDKDIELSYILDDINDPDNYIAYNAPIVF